MDKETIQTLLDLLNPLHGSLDKQTYDVKLRESFSVPADAEYDVSVTAQQERDLTQAVCILEDRLRSSPDTDRAAALAALRTAVQHIEHMAAWIGKQNAGYSFESLGEDMPGIRAALASA